MLLLLAIEICVPLVAKAPTDLPVLSRVAEVRKLAAAEARRGYPVHLRGS